jgi:hypothetical protein
MIKLYTDGKKFTTMQYGREMFRSIDQIASPKKKSKRNANGRMAEHMVISELYRRLEWIGTQESSNVLSYDVTASPPTHLTVVCVQVKSLFGNNHIVHIYPDDMETNDGPVWVFVVETAPEHFAYLVLTHDEIRALVSKLKLRQYPNRRRQEYDLNVPKTLEGFMQYKDAWHKIEENALIPQNRNGQVSAAVTPMSN